MVQTFDEAAETVRSLLKGYPQVNKAYIFGSFSHGAQTSKSDVDILVELDKPMGFDFYGMMQDIEDAVGRSVDVITVTQAKELEKKYEYRIIDKARAIYERTTHSFRCRRCCVVSDSDNLS